MMKIKKLISISLGLCMCMTIPVISCNASEHESKATGGIFFIKTSEDFEKGTTKNLKLDNSIGDGALVLSNNQTNGVYTSQIITSEAFEYLLVSLNADTPKGTWVKVEARALVKYLDEEGNWTESWSDWLSWGKWGNYIKRASVSGDSSLAKISTDEFTIKGSSGETASKFQLRAVLNSDISGVTPSLRQLTASYRNTLPSQQIDKGTIDVGNWQNTIDTPAYSQYIRDPEIAGRICSPTSLTMLLNRTGEDLIVEETSWSVYDNDYMAFGNWVFNAAFAGSRGYESYIEYGNLDVLKREISNSYPVAVSVKYTNDINNTTYPYIENAPMTTSGHIIVICGFKEVNGVQYVVVNDPAAKSDDTTNPNSEVNRMYRLDQFEKAWSRGSNVIYIVHDKEDGAGYGVEPRVQANVVLDSKSGRYNLVVNDEALSLNKKFVKTLLVTSDGGFTSEYVPYKKTIDLTDTQLTNSLYLIGNDGLTYAYIP